MVGVIAVRGEWKSEVHQSTGGLIACSMGRNYQVTGLFRQLIAFCFEITV
jgi:hypothetical protein